MEECPECEGTGEIYWEVPMSQGFGRDSGYLEEVVEVCELCGGDGEIYIETDDDE